MLKLKVACAEVCH